MAYRFVITLDLPEGEAPEVDDALDAAIHRFYELGVLVREEGYSLKRLDRFAVVRWLKRRSADVVALIRSAIRGEGDAMRSARLLKEDLAAAERAE